MITNSILLSLLFILLINQERIPEAVSYLALWRQTVQGYNVTREQLEMMLFLISGNCEGVVELLSLLEEQNLWQQYARFEGSQYREGLVKSVEVFPAMEERSDSAVCSTLSRWPVSRMPR